MFLVYQSFAGLNIQVVKTFIRGLKSKSLVRLVGQVCFTTVTDLFETKPSSKCDAFYLNANFVIMAFL